MSTAKDSLFHEKGERETNEKSLSWKQCIQREFV